MNRQRLTADSTDSEGEDRLPFSPLVGCLLAIVIALAGGFFVLQIGRLMYFGEIRFGGPDLNPNRIWLVRESENAGISISRTKVISGSLDDEQVCLRTRIRSIFWRRDDSPPIAGYCLCYQRANDAWSQTGDCPSGALP